MDHHQCASNLASFAASSTELIQANLSLTSAKKRKSLVSSSITTIQALQRKELLLKAKVKATEAYVRLPVRNAVFSTSSSTSTSTSSHLHPYLHPYDNALLYSHLRATQTSAAAAAEALNLQKAVKLREKKVQSGGYMLTTGRSAFVYEEEGGLGGGGVVGIRIDVGEGGVFRKEFGGIVFFSLVSIQNDDSDSDDEEAGVYFMFCQHTLPMQVDVSGIAQRSFGERGMVKVSKLAVDFLVKRDREKATDALTQPLSNHGRVKDTC